VAKILGNPGALTVLTGQHVIARARLQLLRAITVGDGARRVQLTLVPPY
jgi:hypothetical protein